MPREQTVFDCHTLLLDMSTHLHKMLIIKRDGDLTSKPLKLEISFIQRRKLLKCMLHALLQLNQFSIQ